MNGSTTPTGQSSIPDLNRVVYFDGQRLAAEDLNEAATVQRELRWLHNRSLHNWGIGLGFAVSGNKGDRQVTVGLGYAVDCLGREIILTEPLTRAVPARSDDGQGNPVIYYLVAAYPDDTQLAAVERRKGECGTDGAVRLQDRANIFWKAQGEQAVQVGIEIVLAQATVQNCQLAKPLSLDQRRSARPLQQPFVAAGSTMMGFTPWEPLTTKIQNTDTLIGVKAEIDTSDARFGSTPQYQAQLWGERYVPLNKQNGQGGFLVEGLTYVAEPARNSFTFNVLLPRNLSVFGNTPVNPDSLFASGDTLVKAVKDNWWVVWIGVEG